MPIVCCCCNFHSTLSTWQARWELFFAQSSGHLLSHRNKFVINCVRQINRSTFNRCTSRDDDDKHTACIIAFVFIHRNSDVRFSLDHQPESPASAIASNHSYRLRPYHFLMSRLIAWCYEHLSLNLAFVRVVLRVFNLHRRHTSDHIFQRNR